MTVTVSTGKVRIHLPTSVGRVNQFAQALTLPSSGVLAFPSNAGVPSSPQVAPFIQFPAPWAAVSDAAGIRLILHNFSLFTPVQPTLLNADGSVFYSNMQLVQPGGTVTSWGITNDIVPGRPTSALKLALQNIVTGDVAGFSFECKAWAV